MSRYPHMTGLILAGGTGSRLGGVDKAFLEIGGKSFIQGLLELTGRLFGRTLIVTNDPRLYAGLKVRVVRDLIPGRGAIMGLITGLFYAPTDWSFVTACDAPLLKEELVELVVESIGPRERVILPRTPDGLQPLTAAYHRDCRHPLGRLERSGERSLRSLYDQVPVRVIGSEDVLRVDPGLESFININTPDDLAELSRANGPRKMAGSGV